MSKKIFFASDFHLGADGACTSIEREKKIVKWLSEVQDEMEALYLVGDIFDYWFEYSSTIPKGFSRFFGKLAELRDKDIPIYFFTGNHDMWMFDYFESEFGIPVYYKPIQRRLQGREFFIGHGDGLGPNDIGYKLIKKVFSNPICQWAYARLHPNFGIWLMKRFSHKSRALGGDSNRFLGRDKEMLVQYAERKLQSIQPDYFVFGHRHLPLKVQLSNKTSTYFGLGDWLYFQSYGVLDQGEFSLRYYELEDKTQCIE
ncbi:MAG: UDP-2,3-diacylglucosamine diphosphatase [Saprospiraceae bacterium]|nr:UDP-2,3-diacylglucosamine diphosphatase [Saprospiraceae bacterium]